MKIVWAVLCENSVIDRDTNNVSLINVLEQMQLVAEPPVLSEAEPIPESRVPAQMQMVILSERSDMSVPERGRCRLRLITPDGKESHPSEFEVDLTKTLRHRFRMNFQGIPITSQGRYMFTVDVKAETGHWIESFEVPLEVSIIIQDS